jgi:hypothetical protein
MVERANAKHLKFIASHRIISIDTVYRPAHLHIPLHRASPSAVFDTVIIRQLSPTLIDSST